VKRERPAAREDSGKDFTRQGERDERLGRSRRILHSADFDEIFAEGQRYGGRYLTLWVWKGPNAALRLGVVASRKVGGAVQRNRAKRMRREIWRRNRFRFQASADVVLSARSDILAADFRTVEAELLRLAERAGLYSPGEGR